MSAQKYGGTMVDKFQRRTCLEALKRKGAMTLEGVSHWTSLSQSETERHLKSLIADQLVMQVGAKFTADVAS